MAQKNLSLTRYWTNSDEDEVNNITLPGRDGQKKTRGGLLVPNCRTAKRLTYGSRRGLVMDKCLTLRLGYIPFLRGRRILLSESGRTWPHYLSNATTLTFDCS